MCVPPPSGSTAKKVYEKLLSMESSGQISRKDSAERRMDLITYLFKEEEKETAKAFEKQMVIIHDFYKNL